MSSRGRRLTAAVLLIAAPAACSPGGGSPSVDVPAPEGKAAAACREFGGGLPEKVDGLERRDTEPPSRLTAAWGDPAVELRCGVPRPAVLTPGDEHYNPTADAVVVNGVEWLLEDAGDTEGAGRRFTTTNRVAYIEVTVPGEYAPEVNALTDLADAVKEAVPGRL